MKLYQILTLLLLLAACGDPKSIEEKKKQLATKKEALTKLKAEISTLEGEISAAMPASAKETATKLVETMALAPEDFAHYVEVQANVASDQNVMVAPEIPGLILRRRAEEGQAVRAGQIIAEVDAENARRSIAEMETRMELARTTFERQSNLWNQKIGTEIQYLQAKNAMDALEKGLATMKSQLNKAYIKAPISGILEQFMQNVGEMGNPAVPMARIVNNTTVKITADVSEAYTRSIKRGDQVLVSFPSLGKELNLRVESTGQVVNPINRTFRLLMRTGNPDGYLKPNTLAVVKIRDFYQQKALSIPTYLIQQSATGQKFVYVLRKKEGKDTSEKVNIASGQSYAGKTLITEGLQPGDMLITKGYNEVLNGDAVKVVSETKVAIK